MDGNYPDAPQPRETWNSLAQLLHLNNPLFDNTLFLFGYDFSSNIYLIQGDYLSLIDAGNDYTAFMQLFELGLKPWEIKKVVLTHGHVDHCMGIIELFRGYPQQAQEVEVILHEAGPREFKEIINGVCRVTEVRGGETIELNGLELEVIHTPGHTLDSICLYHPPTYTMFTGDTVMPHAMAEPDKEGGGRMDHYLYALRTLRKREISYILPGHGGVVANNGKKVVDDTYDGLIKKIIGLETPRLAGAKTLAQQGLLEEALFYTNKEIAEFPEDLMALEIKAFLLNDLGRSYEAIEVFDNILRGKNQDTNVLMGKGLALIGIEKFTESLEIFNEIIAIKPDLQEASLYKGFALYLSGKQEDALDIDIFKTEFAHRMKHELLQMRPAAQQ
jgi:glyoxylase-like metal-dependent hydrolase (beta-lactamase superfamily II)